MLSNITWQRQKGKRFFMIERIDCPAFWQAGTLGFFAFAALDIRSKASGPCGDFFAGERVLTQRLRFISSCRIAIAFTAELTGEFAFGIIGATDKCAILTELQRELTCSASRAGAWIAAITAIREGKRSQFFVERVENIGNTEFLDVVDGAGEIAPKSRSTSFHDSLPSEIRSSFSSRSAVKSYST